MTGSGVMSVCRDWSYFKYLLNCFFCSFDHDGLGRYGDPINPDADLEAMQNAQRLLRPGHKMFLTVPIGK